MPGHQLCVKHALLLGLKEVRAEEQNCKAASENEEIANYGKLWRSYQTNVKN